MIHTIRPSLPVFSGKSQGSRRSHIASGELKTGDAYEASGKSFHIPKPGKKSALLTLMMLAGSANASTLPTQARRDVSLAGEGTGDILEILKCPPFEPTDHRLFVPQTYTDTPDLVPADVKPVNSTEIKAQLGKTLTFRFPENKTAVQEGMDLLADSQLKALVPDIRLQASLAALKGTPGEAAIDVIKNGAFRSVRFENLPSGIIAASKPDPANRQKPELLFNKQYESEDFRLFSSGFAHEALHQDSIASGREERISHSLDTLVYGKLIEEDPSLAESGTELARRQNTKLMARLNSRDAQGNLRLFTAQGNVYPNGTSLENFAAAFKSTDPNSPNGTITDNSPGNDLLKQYLLTMTGTDLDKPDFDAETEQLIDEKQTALTPAEVVRAAQALKLNVDCVEKKPPSDNQPGTPHVTSGAGQRAVVPSPFRLAAELGKRILG